MKLFEFAPTRSIRARWALQELGVEFESRIVDLRIGENRSPEYLMVNPAGKIPALIDGDVTLTESVAIVVYLAEKYPDAGLLTSDPTSRAQTFRWLLFTATELEQPLWRAARHEFLYEESERIPLDIELARRDFGDMAEILEAHLRDREYLVGGDFSAADIVCAYTLDWANENGWLEGFPLSIAYMERQYERPRAPMRIAAAFASINPTQ